MGLPIAMRQKDRFRLQVVASHTGHLYVFAEPANQSELNVLFPSPTANNGVSFLEAGNSVQIPKTSWLEFGQKPGVERLWLVWSATPNESLESARRWANVRDGGSVGDPKERERIRSMLTRETNKIQISSGRLTLEGSGELLVGSVGVRHN